MFMVSVNWLIFLAIKFGLDGRIQSCRIRHMMSHSLVRKDPELKPALKPKPAL